MLAKWRLLSEESKTIRTDDPASRLYSDLPGKPRYSKNVHRDESVRENLLTRTNVRFGSKAAIGQRQLSARSGHSPTTPLLANLDASSDHLVSAQVRELTTSQFPHYLKKLASPLGTTLKRSRVPCASRLPVPSRPPRQISRSPDIWARDGLPNRARKRPCSAKGERLPSPRPVKSPR